MESWLLLKTKYREIRLFKKTIALFSKKKNSVRFIDTQNLKSTKFKSESKINDVRITSKNIHILSQNRVQKLALKSYKILKIAIIPKIINYHELESDFSLVCNDKNLLLYDSNGFSKSNGYDYTQIIGDYFIAVSPKMIIVYGKQKEPVYSSSIGEFEKRFFEIYYKNLKNPLDKTLKHIYFSIYNRKLYLLVEDRIVGRDLNIYIQDIKKTPELESCEKSFTIDKFQCISKAVILLDKENRKVVVASKNLEKKVFSTPGDDFYYNNDDQELFVLYNGSLMFFKTLNIYTKPFKLIDESLVFQEAEDEFDESDDSFFDFE
ncbi:hypothetical protein GINT2_001870 [Glugoides intestinalis]